MTLLCLWCWAFGHRWQKTVHWSHPDMRAPESLRFFTQRVRRGNRCSRCAVWQ